MVFSLLNTMYVPYAAVYYVDRVHLMCSINTACQHLTLSDYLTSEIIIMGVGVILHCPVWFFVLLLLDIKKSGGNISDLFKYFTVSFVCPRFFLVLKQPLTILKFFRETVVQSGRKLWRITISENTRTRT